MSEPRRFNEREVAEIVRLATEGRAKPASTDGLTLSEIQAVVGELGLDSGAMADAAKQVEAGLPESYIHGSQVEFLRTYDGELDDAGWEEMLLIARRRAGQAGEVTVRGNTREWNGGAGGLELYHLSATSKDGKTRVRLTQDVSGVVFLIWLMAFLPLLLGPVVIISKSMKAGADMLWPVILSAMITFIVSALAAHYSKKQKRRAAKLGEMLAEFDPLIKASALAEALRVEPAAEDVRMHLGQ